MISFICFIFTYIDKETDHLCKMILKTDSIKKIVMRNNLLKYIKSTLN